MENSKTLFVALVGKPNVGKSSLMNKLLGEKLAIVTSKPQTTRTRITGILTKDNVQYVFLDTPGVHIPRNKLGNRMIKSGQKAIGDADLVAMLFECGEKINDAELGLIKSVKDSRLPGVAVINKIDLANKKSEPDSLEKYILDTGAFRSVYRLSALTGRGVGDFLKGISEYAYKSPHYFDDDSLTDIPEKTIVAEIFREKILMFMRDEIPHGTHVEVEYFKENKNGKSVDLGILIYCEKESHKGMIIGKKGAMLKKIASLARADIENFLQAKVNMECWVKVREGWRNQEYSIKDFGYREE